MNSSEKIETSEKIEMSEKGKEEEKSEAIETIESNLFCQKDQEDKSTRDILKYLDIVSNFENIDPRSHIILSGKHKLIRKINQLNLELSRALKFTTSLVSDFADESDTMLMMINQSSFTLLSILNFLQFDDDFSEILHEIAHTTEEMNNSIELLEQIKVINNNVPNNFLQIHLRTASILGDETASILLKQNNTKLIPYFVSLSYLLLLLSY